MRKHRLRLVIRRMRHGHLVDTPVLDKAREKIVTRPPRRILQIGFPPFSLGRNIRAARMKDQATFLSQLRREFFIPVGIFAAQFVIEVRNAKHNSKLLAQFREQQQQRHRIGAPR